MQAHASWGEIARHSRLPWDAIERQRKRIEEGRRDAHSKHDEASAQIAAMLRPVHGGMRDIELGELAKKRAHWMAGQVAGLGTCEHDEFVRRINDVLVSLDARPIRDEGRGLEPIIKRALCSVWWRRQLKRAVLRERERLGRDRAEIAAIKRQPYVTDDTMHRLKARDKASADMLEATEIESQDGDVINLAQASAASVSNPSIRRGELMTRINGCEQWAQANGWRGIFTTHTTPSRFHAVGHDGQINPKWIEAGKPTPKDGQLWLCDKWGKTRAALQRRCLEFFGVRVAEPHHDGTPHWHMLIFARPGDRAAIAKIMRRYWLSDDGDEAGAKKHRFKAKSMQAGGAAGYCAKYISKGIDDEGDTGASGHVDDLPDGRKLHMPQGDMLGGGAARVRAWARAHGIRQFQALGQPPVTAWRELRRIKKADLVTATQDVCDMWEATNREGDKKASWADYMTLQGGPCQGRHYQVAVATEERINEGRYETVMQDKPVGVIDRFDAAGYVVRSSRKEWKPKGAWNGGNRRTCFDQSAVVGLGSVLPGIRGRLVDAGQPLKQAEGAQPWTRVNNCTGQEAKTVHRPAGKLVYDWREFFSPDLVAEISNGRGIASSRNQENEQSVQRVAVGQGDRQGP